MLRKDYLQRQFEEFGKALSLILSLKNKKDWENFEREIQEATQKFTSLEVDEVENMTDETFEKEILNNTNLTRDQRKILGNLLFEKLNFYLAMDEQEKYSELKDKCLVLYTQMKENFTQNEYDLDVHYKLDFLRDIR